MIEDDEDVYDIRTIEEYRTAVLRLESVADLAERIADRWSRQGTTITKFGVDAVYYTYNGSCHCHPEEHEGSFPVSLLFDPEWEAKINTNTWYPLGRSSVGGNTSWRRTYRVIASGLTAMPAAISRGVWLENFGTEHVS